MIILDTHVWVWHVQDDERLPKAAAQVIKQNEQNGLGVSSFSLWEVAKIVERKKLKLSVEINEWFEIATEYPGVQILPITSPIAIESTKLPGDFHKDPADQIIVATARIYDCPLITVDKEILAYAHVKLLP